MFCYMELIAKIQQRKELNIFIDDKDLKIHTYYQQLTFHPFPFLLHLNMNIHATIPNYT